MGLLKLLFGSSSNSSKSSSKKSSDVNDYDNNLYDLDVCGTFGGLTCVETRAVKRVYIDSMTIIHLYGPCSPESESLARRFFPTLKEFHHLFYRKSK